MPWVGLKASGLQALESMQQAGNRPEPALYASLVQCLWDSAVPAAQAQAGKLFVVGCRSGAVLSPLQQNNKEDRTLEVMSHLLPCNIAVAVGACSCRTGALQQASPFRRKGPDLRAVGCPLPSSHGNADGPVRMRDTAKQWGRPQRSTPPT